jgi:hypothetical protein
VGAVVIMEPDGKTVKGFNVVVGGGMGRTHRKEVRGCLSERSGLLCSRPAADLPPFCLSCLPLSPPPSSPSPPPVPSTRTYSHHPPGIPRRGSDTPSRPAPPCAGDVRPRGRPLGFRQGG